MNKYAIGFVLILAVLCTSIFSQMTKFPLKDDSNVLKPKMSVHGKVDKKDKDVIKPNIENSQLREDLAELRKDFEAEMRALKEEYREKRKSLFKKYGVKPPKRDKDKEKNKGGILGTRKPYGNPGSVK